MRIERLEIDDLRSIKKLRWPEDGLGWNGRIPDVVVVVGANGGGKTTLLNEIFDYFKMIFGYNNILINLNHNELKAVKFKSNIKNNIEISNGDNVRIISGDSSLYDVFSFLSLNKGKIIYFKSKRTSATFSRNKAQKVQNVPEPTEYSYVWDQDTSNDITIENLCYFARWEDANHFLNGRPEKAVNFKFYADEFERFTEGQKKLVWTDDGVLLVETRDGVRHDVNEMSSGEHQALIFSIMLSRWWTPGSIVLIDEPELHLHTHWQAKLLQRIIDLQKERGGQAILATQSSDLFSMAPSRSQVLLGGWER